MEENKRREDNFHSDQKNYDSSKHHHHFQVKYFPKGLFQLFNKNETSYIYEKKFSCQLPKDIIPPKSFHYPFSLEKYCQSDLLTMDFDLKKNPDILTDPKINTFIHQDFINNSLELIFPNLTTISKKRTDEEQNFKKKIIEIIESSEEVEQEFNPALSEIPDFLRRHTYLRPSTVVTNEKKSKIKDKGKDKKKTSQQDLVKSIEQSFNDIDKIKIGMNHPDQKLKGIKAKNVYELSPMENMPNIKFIEYLFPSEPSDVPNLDPKYLKPDHFIITNNKANDINQENTCSLYINNKLETQKDHTKKDIAEYFTYEREFTYSKMTQNDLFNRYFIILDKGKKKLKIAPLSDKISFRRYKKMTEANLNNNENQEEGKDNNNKLNKKRKRDIIIVPQNLEKEELEEKKKWLNERGYTIGFTERKINQVDHCDAMEVERERKKDEEIKMQKMKLVNEDIEENEDNEENEENRENEENEENEFDGFGSEIDEENNEENNEEKENLSNKNENEDEQNNDEGKKEENEESYENEKKDKQEEENEDDIFD